MSDLIIEIFNDKDELVQREVYTEAQALTDRHTDKCNHLCSYCYYEACKWLGEQEQ